MMRNNRNTSAIDYEGYISTLDVILSPMVRPWLLTTGTGFNLKGGLWNRGDSGERHQ
jgi:hypothetical protein